MKLKFISDDKPAISTSHKPGSDVILRIWSHGVVKHDVLARQLQQHRIVEKFVDADVFTQSL